MYGDVGVKWGYEGLGVWNGDEMGGVGGVGVE